MSLQATASGERLHIGFFGMRNAGKSSVVNAVTKQRISVVSETLGTTTDPVQKAMELLPLGPVVIIDTPGFDDEGALGALRVERTREVLRKTDIAVLVVDAVVGLTDADRALLMEFGARKLPHIIAYNKSDLLVQLPTADNGAIYVSPLTGEGIDALKEKLALIVQAEEKEKRIAAIHGISKLGLSDEGCEEYIKKLSQSKVRPNEQPHSSPRSRKRRRRTKFLTN